MLLADFAKPSSISSDLHVLRFAATVLILFSLQLSVLFAIASKFLILCWGSDLNGGQFDGS
jgi:hypothetical protein